MIYLSFIPWILYILVNIKYSKKDLKPINYKVIIVTLIFLYFTKYNTKSYILLPIFFVSNIYLLIDTYYNIPSNKEKVKNDYSKFLYAIIVIPIIAYMMFEKQNIIYISMYVISFLVDAFIYIYTKKDNHLSKKPK